MTKFDNLKVKRVKSNLKYTDSTVKGRNTKKSNAVSYSYHAERYNTKGNTLKGN